MDSDELLDTNNQTYANYLTNIQSTKMTHTTFKTMGLRKTLENNLCLTSWFITITNSIIIIR